MKIIDYVKEHREEIIVACVVTSTAIIGFKKGFDYGKEHGRKKFIDELKIFQELTKRPSTIVMPRRN